MTVLTVITIVIAEIATNALLCRMVKIDIKIMMAMIVVIVDTIALLYRIVKIDIKIMMAMIVVMTVIFIMAVYCICRNGCNINVYIFIGYHYNCLNGL